MADLLGPIAVALLLGVVGLVIILLGARARAGRVDLALGSHTRENTDPVSWERAHQIIGEGLIWAGLGFVAAGISFPVIYLIFDDSETPAAITLLALVGLAIACMFIAILVGLKAITPAQAGPQENKSLPR